MLAWLDRVHPAGAAAQRLEREGARARAAVDDVKPVEALPEPVEERLLHAIGQRPRREARRRDESPPLERPTDDAEAGQAGLPPARTIRSAWISTGAAARSPSIFPAGE